eukprot:GHRQ01015227.1.p3 GENE.GHRQ01015227.1~~GHRQ01015227.1.p3  ORF type:complete len:107 (-),score=10.91 GHRQ01015227.1:461-781(-)
MLQSDTAVAAAATSTGKDRQLAQTLVERCCQRLSRARKSISMQTTAQRKARRRMTVPRSTTPCCHFPGANARHRASMQYEYHCYLLSVSTMACASSDRCCVGCIRK